ncbi:DUF1802 family protein [Leptolyngbya sp. AN02str]|uniref:DUF1802 family protein n=1 Tax=Leptolyngbya sp. AN02str TaxID=3423363 RepID=UPI003D311CB2
MVNTSLPIALSLPAPELEALLQGRMIVVNSRTFITPGRSFALYPSQMLVAASIDEVYHPNFVPSAKAAIARLQAKGGEISAWAKCEFCQCIDSSASLEKLSNLTVWTVDGLNQFFAQQRQIFLTYIRVYHLPQPVYFISNTRGQFIKLPKACSATSNFPVLDEASFRHRRYVLERFEDDQKLELNSLASPPDLALAELEAVISNLACTDSRAKALHQDIRFFLGWSKIGSNSTYKDANFTWIKEISLLADRSLEEDTRKSNYQAGTDFEIIVRRSLDFLGFTIEEEYKGGAGGLDLYCSKPYPLAGECKSGKSIPSRAVEELEKIAKRHLKENYLRAKKLVIGSGKPTPQLQESANYSRVSIITAMTLQKLVELAAQYPGSIDLLALKEYLIPGQIDDGIQRYINSISKELKLRSNVIQAVKELEKGSSSSTTKGLGVIEIRVCHDLKFSMITQKRLDDKEIHEILVELSSPLAGYLGRIKGSNWEADRFYYLRDLAINRDL